MSPRAHKLLQHWITQQRGAPGKTPVLNELLVASSALLLGSLFEGYYSWTLSWLIYKESRSKQQATDEAIKNQLALKILMRALDITETVINRNTDGKVGKEEIQEYFCQTDGTVAWNVVIEGLVPLIVDYVYNNKKPGQAEHDLFAGITLLMGAFAVDYAAVYINKGTKEIVCP